MIDYTIPQPLVERAFLSRWHDGGRGAMYTRTDRDRPEKTDRKVLVGNLAEVAAYGAFCGKLGVPCLFPNLKKIKNPGSEVWPDDLIFMDEWKLGRRNLGKNHTVKGQFYGEAKEYSPSWLFQLSARGRKQDPILENSELSCLFVGVLIDDSSYSSIPNVSIACKIYTFYWPKVSQFMQEPAVAHNKGYKKALYLRDIDLHEIHYDKLQLQQ